MTLSIYLLTSIYLLFRYFQTLHQAIAMALAESSVEDIEKQSLKCRKCRFLVIEDPPHKILNISPTGVLADEDSSNTFNICDETLPYWISAAIEEV